MQEQKNQALNQNQELTNLKTKYEKEIYNFNKNHTKQITELKTQHEKQITTLIKEKQDIEWSQKQTQNKIQKIKTLNLKLSYFLNQISKKSHAVYNWHKNILLKKRSYVAKTNTTKRSSL